jgi:alpha-glucosidase
MGQDCKGTLYQDDGKSYDFMQGKFLRMDSACSLKVNRLHIHIGPHQGSYNAWSSEITIEVYGWTYSEVQAKLAGVAVKSFRNNATNSWQMTVPDNGKGLELELR